MTLHLNKCFKFKTYKKCTAKFYNVRSPKIDYKQYSNSVKKYTSSRGGHPGTQKSRDLKGTRVPPCEWYRSVPLRCNSVFTPVYVWAWLGIFFADTFGADTSSHPFSVGLNTMPAGFFCRFGGGGKTAWFFGGVWGTAGVVEGSTSMAWAGSEGISSSGLQVSGKSSSNGQPFTHWQNVHTLDTNSIVDWDTCSSGDQTKSKTHNSLANMTDAAVAVVVVSDHRCNDCSWPFHEWHLFCRLVAPTRTPMVSVLFDFLISHDSTSHWLFLTFATTG